MDLKIEILESYSRVHNRHLLLLEQDTDPRAPEAAAILAKAQWNPNPNNKQHQVAVINGVEVRHNVNAKSRHNVNAKSVSNNSGEAFWDPISSTLTPKGSEKRFKAFITSIVGKGDLQTDTGDKEETSDDSEVSPLGAGLPPGELVKMADLSKETRQETATNFVKVSNRVQKLWDDLEDDLKAKFTSIAVFANYFTGARQESFEKQLVSAKLKMEFKDGEWVAIPEPPQDSQTSKISKSFSDLVELVSSGECDDGEVLKDFAQTKRGDVLISPKGDHEDRSEALAFRDSKGFLKMLLKKAYKTCSIRAPKFVKLRTSHTNNPGGDNAIRGLAFEEILEIVSLLRLKNSLDKDQKKKLSKFIKTKVIALQAKLSKLTLDSELWIKMYEESGLDPNQAGLIEEIGEILQGGALNNNLYASMIKHSNQSVKVRGSIYALPVGDQTGSGQRQDVLEIFASSEDALEAAKKSGVKGIQPMCGTVEETFQGGSEDTLRALKDSGVFGDGQEVCSLKVSLKNYMDLKHAVFGGGRFTTFKNLIKDFSDSKFSETIRNNLGMDESDTESFLSYASEMDKIGKHIFDIPLEVGVRINKTNELINHNSAKSFAETLISDLNTNFGYEELNGPGELATLKKMAEEVVSGKMTKSEVAATYRKLQEKLNTFVQHKKVQRDIAAGGERAKQAKLFAAVKMFHAGGSDDDNLVCDYRGLMTNENYVFKQNDPLRDAWKSINSNDGKWDIEVSTSGRTTLSLKGTNVKITMETNTIPSKNSKGKATGYNTNYSCKVNRACLDHYNTLDSALKEKHYALGKEDLKGLLSEMRLLFKKIAIVGIK